nr:collagen alpha-1(I) chain-like [Vulpes vulpes]
MESWVFLSGSSPLARSLGLQSFQHFPGTFTGSALPCAALCALASPSPSLWFVLAARPSLPSSPAPQPEAPGALGSPGKPEPGLGIRAVSRDGRGQGEGGAGAGERTPGPPGSDLPGAHGARRCPRVRRAPFARGVSHTQQPPRVENLPAGTSQTPGTLSSPAFGCTLPESSGLVGVV